MSKDASNAEISQLDNVLLCEEHVLALDVSVEDLAIVHVLHAQADLRKPVHDLRL